jgi:hypothetical protein
MSIDWFIDVLPTVNPAFNVPLFLTIDKFVSDGGLILHIQKCTSVSTSNKTDSHDIIEILLNVALKFCMN